MIRFHLNGQPTEYSGDPDRSLLHYLRRDRSITSPKDGCSGQAACGACAVEVDGRVVLSCVTPMKKVDGASVCTIEGFPEYVRRILGRAFTAAGAVQCGFCTPGLLVRTKALLEQNPSPSRDEAARAIGPHLCRCTGYVKIVDAILLAADALRQGSDIAWESEIGVGRRTPKADAYDKALGRSPFIDDMTFDDLLFGALRFSDHPRARVLAIDVSRAEALPGVVRVFTAEDVPGQRHQGLIEKDWPMLLARGEETRCIGDVIASVVADSEETARHAAGLIEVQYEELSPVTEVEEAAREDVKIHPKGNLLKETVIRRGDPVDDVLSASAFTVQGVFETPFVEHAFLETEAAVALPWGRGVRVYSQSQGIFEDRHQIASMLGLAEEDVDVWQIATGGAFGGKEDLTVQHHAALMAFVLGKPVKVRLSRPESIRMHPKRHRMRLDYRLGCDENGMLTALHARITGDTGAYASVGGEVVARTGTHAGGAYHVPNVDVVARAYYTNNPPAGAFRGFGVNQAAFAMESLIDDLCKKGGFDPWQFRYDNALAQGRMTTTGHVLGEGVGLRQCLLAVKPAYDAASCAGLACALKNVGIGNGIEEVSQTRLKIAADGGIELYHGWTEMGQGIGTVARQILCEVLGLDQSVRIDVIAHTDGGAEGGVTTASRGTALLGNSIIAAAEKMMEDLQGRTLTDLAGREYFADCVIDYTTGPGEGGEIVSHFSYGYAAQLAVLDEDGKIIAIHAAHDGGRIVNPALFEGQVEGGVVMGLGYALSEKLDLDKGRLVSDRMRKLGLLRAKDVPEIIVHLVEAPDPAGPFGAKGVGEIGTIPTAPAVANAFFAYDGVRRHSLPMSPPKPKTNQG